MTRKYYRILLPEKSSFGVLTAPKETPFDLIKENETQKDWKILMLELVNGENFGDYTISMFAYRICSKKLKNVIDNFLRPNDPIQWLPLSAKSPKGEIKDLYHLHFSKKQDVLNEQFTTYNKRGFVNIPKFSYQKIKDKHIFSYSPSSFIVSEELKEAIELVKCTNIIFSEIPVINDQNETSKIA